MEDCIYGMGGKKCNIPLESLVAPVELCAPGSRVPALPTWRRPCAHASPDYVTVTKNMDRGNKWTVCAFEKLASLRNVGRVSDNS